MSYLYDPAGRRVAKLQSGSIVKQYYYDAGGQMIEATDGSGSVLRAEIYAGARRLATWVPASGGGKTYFTYSDELGTERVRTDSSGAVCQTLSSLPFGDGESSSGSCAPTPNFFTGLQRDAESGLDHTKARQYASGFGAWLSPDPENAGEVDADPQSWDAYGYVMDNPTTDTDPSGLDCLYVSSASANSINVATEPGQCTWPGGHYVAGTVNPHSFVYSGNSLDFSFTPYSGASAGVGSIDLRGSGPSGDQQALDTLSLAGQEASAGVRDAAVTMAENAVFVGAFRMIGLSAEALATSGSATDTEIEDVPQSARDTLRQADEKGSPVPGMKGGKTYGNWNNKLPNVDASGNQIRYREWDVEPAGPTGRGPGRLITGSDGSAYYSPNHYGGFIKIR